MSREEFCRWFDERFTAFVKGRTARYERFTHKEELLEMIGQVEDLAEKGKRVRPYLVYLAYHAHTNKGPEEIERALFAVELFHTFCLVHDDIIDEDDLRRGVPTVNSVAQATYKKYRKGLAKRAGAAQAILVGDLVFSWVFELMAPYFHDEELTREFLFTIDEVVIGQMIDVDLMAKERVTKEAILEKMRLKTAGYTFVQPLRIGRLLARKREPEENIDALGVALGMGFQMQDDLLDIFSSEQEIGKDLASDIEESQHTLLTQYVADHGSEHDIRELHVLIGKAVDDDRLHLLRDLFERTGAANALREEIKECMQNARNKAEGCNWPEGAKKALVEFVEYVAERRY